MNEWEQMVRMKPRIKKLQGISCYACRGGKAMGIGNTPHRAWLSWVCNLRLIAGGFGV